MKDDEKKFGDRSPEIAREKRLEHERRAKESNYKIALNYLADLEQSSTLLIRADSDATTQSLWTDHKGNAWITEQPMQLAERETLATVLEVIADYEREYSRYQEKESVRMPIGNSTDKAMADISELRRVTDKSEHNRLDRFNQIEKDDAIKDNPMERSEVLESHENMGLGCQEIETPDVDR
jgi:hypothetical protein